MPKPLRYNKNFEKLSYEEKQLLEETKKSIADFVEYSSTISDVNYATRNAHAKTYAVLKGVFIINKDIPQDLKSVFDSEQYEITARLSNAHLKINKSKKDVPAYGFAIKIKDDSGRTISNYPLVNFPLFPVNSVSIFLKLFTSLNRFFVKKWSNSFSVLKQIYKVIPFTLNPSFLKNVFKLLLNKNNFILSFDFHSVGAYRFDDKMIKIKVSPKNVEKNFGKKQFVKDAVEDFFKTNDFEADVYIQFCYNLKDQPINKLNVEWKNSPFIKIGEIKIEKNSLLNPKSCENELLSFNPFDSAEIFQPVGKIQKLRDEAYKVSLQTRKKINKLLKYK
ncbi:catalase [Chryseobacterium sp. Ch-15]|uniref:Catalase n=1 Tax=Chryseobacterium muglaense TaxID=2893752 RepID=A0A9Q3YRP4_9FLAO|nr:catalase [Chryseobacterium muglaense]MBD3904870.1 catalase [Chryseobacterium muglaense]MCC9034418.1 catalase [Chryseobacterium muglaense]MCM2554525.1 catalase [Chryseobacterium muglaense]